MTVFKLENKGKRSSINCKFIFSPFLSIVVLVNYFNVFQHISYARTQQLFKDIFNLPISQGSIENHKKKVAKKAKPVYQTILKNIKSAGYVGADETGAKVNGEKWWTWVWQNIENTFLRASKSRGFDTVEQLFPDNATIGSDRWAAPLKTASKDKQICFPHLQQIIFEICYSHFR